MECEGNIVIPCRCAHYWSSLNLVVYFVKNLVLSFACASDSHLQACYCSIRCSLRKTPGVWGWGSKGFRPDSLWHRGWGRNVQNVENAKLLSSNTCYSWMFVVRSSQLEDLECTFVNSTFCHIYFFQVENNPYDPSLMVFMDYRDYWKHKVDYLEAQYPTFLYAMPMSPTRVFFEVWSNFVTILLYIAGVLN